MTQIIYLKQIWLSKENFSSSKWRNKINLEGIRNQNLKLGFLRITFNNHNNGPDLQSRNWQISSNLNVFKYINGTTTKKPIRAKRRWEQ